MSSVQIVVLLLAFPPNACVVHYDCTAPRIYLIGSTVSLHVGEPYREQGATAVDIFDGVATDVSVAISRYEYKSGLIGRWKPCTAVDTSRIGTYRVWYTAGDLAGNTREVCRTVRVSKPWARWGM